MTATFPLPLAASGLSLVIAENVLLKSDVEIVGTVALLDEELEPPDGDDELHAAARTATLAAIDAQASVFVT